MKRLGRKHWSDMPWETGSLGRDDEFRMLEPKDIEAETAAGLEPIDDLAVIVLFSVFEAVVRDFLVRQIRPEAANVTHPVLSDAMQDVIRGFEEGSFYRRVLEPLGRENLVPKELITHVDQVRDYRNWVAHGRRGRPKNNVDPAEAYRRLVRFLETLGIAVDAELTTEPDGEGGE